MNPINLLELYGDQFQITWDECATNKRDPGYMQIPCSFTNTTIYPHGDTVLALQIDGHPKIAKRLLAMGLNLHQDGKSEKTLLFTIDQFDDVTTIVQPRRRRHLSPERREANAKRLLQSNPMLNPIAKAAKIADSRPLPAQAARYRDSRLQKLVSILFVLGEQGGEKPFYFALPQVAKVLFPGLKGEDLTAKEKTLARWLARLVKDGLLVRVERGTKGKPSGYRLK